MLTPEQAKNEGKHILDHHFGKSTNKTRGLKIQNFTMEKAPLKHESSHLVRIHTKITNHTYNTLRALKHDRKITAKNITSICNPTGKKCGQFDSLNSY